MNTEKAARYSGGSWLAAMSTVIPLGISIVSSLAGTIKAASSTNGEIKTKSGDTFKWDNKNTGETYVTPIYYYF
ncbi:hypothetical protein [Mycoplasma phocoenae]|uniref:Uncharacterized protein n=1 Tax=Mycoplasma phocoenae TaxID=754517 RepID=A0A858U6L2_9MOLU|nr:hypothetical protein [Mycoplasma phocoenae]QJG67097.1 hypothetical protein HGG69_02115 [Mycoplasma phocoenae]